MPGTVCYTKELVNYLIDENTKSEIVQKQLEEPEIDVFTGLAFEDHEDVTIDDVYAYIDNMSPEQFAQLQAMFTRFYGNSFNGEDIAEALAAMQDDELVAAVMPSMLESVTMEDAKAFAETDEGKAVIIDYIAKSVDAEPDEAMLENVTDDQILEIYKGVVGSQITADAIRAKIDGMNEDELNALAQSLNPARDIDSLKAALSTMDEQTLLTIFKEQILAQSTDNTYEGNLQKLGQRDPENPFAIYIYSSSFEAKEKFEDFVTKYNDMQIAAGNEESKIEYTDYIGLLLNSVTKIINMVSYVLIGFVSISLVVSSIMIGIITYISVLERTKEIGILRSIGASKRDISRVFNAETFIVGLIAGLIGVIITMLLDIPINMIIEKASGVPDIAFLRLTYAAILVGISVLLTLIAGIIPSKLAAKKDPVIALRTE